MIQLTPVVKNLLIINVLVFFISKVIYPHIFDYLPLYYPEGKAFLEELIERATTENGGTLPQGMEVALERLSYQFQPYQFVTNFFTHFDAQHIFFNMLSLVIFGPQIEMFWSSKRFLFYYFFTGIGAAILSLIMTFVSVHYLNGSPYVAMAGASGCIFGLLAAFGLLFPNNVIQLLFPPIQLKAKYYVLIFGILEFYGGVRQLSPGGSSDNVGHFAHLGGALFGILLILYWNKGGKIGRD